MSNADADANADADTDTKKPYKVGDYVRLKGLSAKYLNGSTGVVEKEEDSITGRVQVMLISPWKDQTTGEVKHHPLSIRVENLRRFPKDKGGLTIEACLNCGVSKRSKALKQCSRCKIAAYCSADCQHSHWKNGHKGDCPIMEQAIKSKGREENLPTDKGDRIFARQTRAQQLMMQSKFKEAEQEFKKIIEMEGIHRNGYYCNVGTTILMQQDPSRHPEAIEYLQKAVSLPRFDPQDEHAYYEACNQLANAYGMSGDKEREKDVLERILRENGPFKAEATGRLARLEKYFESKKKKNSSA